MRLPDPIPKKADRDQTRRAQYTRQCRPSIMVSENRQNRAAGDQEKLSESQYRQVPRLGEKEYEILRPSFSQLREAAVHSRAHRIGSIAKKNSSARALDGPS